MIQVKSPHLLPQEPECIELQAGPRKTCWKKCLDENFLKDFLPNDHESLRPSLGDKDWWCPEENAGSYWEMAPPSLHPGVTHSPNDSNRPPDQMSRQAR